MSEGGAPASGRGPRWVAAAPPKLSEREKSWQAFRSALAAARAGWAGSAEDLRRRRRILDLYREKVRPELEKCLTLAEESLRAGKADLRGEESETQWLSRSTVASW